MNNATFSITAVIKNGVRETSGTRWPIWAGILVCIPIFIITLLIGYTLAGFSPSHEALMARQTTANILPLLPLAHRIYVLLSNMISYIITGPIIAGVIMTAVKKQRGESISAANSFGYFHKFVPLAIFTIVVQLLIAIINPGPTNLIGFNLSASYNLLIAPLLLLFAIFISQSMPLIADKNLNALEAIKTSCSMMLTKGNWRKYVSLYLILAITFIVFLIICAILFAVAGLLASHINEALGVILGIAIGAGIITILILYLPTVINIQANIYKTLTD